MTRPRLFRASAIQLQGLSDRKENGHALILSGDGEATLRDMGSGEERQVDPGTLVDTLSSP